MFLDLGEEGKGALSDLSSKYVQMAWINIQEQFGRAKISASFRPTSLDSHCALPEPRDQSSFEEGPGRRPGKKASLSMQSVPSLSETQAFQRRFRRGGEASGAFIRSQNLRGGADLLLSPRPS